MTEKSKIIKVKKNSEGNITDVMLENGQICTITDAIYMVKEGNIAGVNVGKARNGREYLRSNPNDDESDNLDQKPSF